MKAARPSRQPRGHLDAGPREATARPAPQRRRTPSRGRGCLSPRRARGRSTVTAARPSRQPCYPTVSLRSHASMPRAMPTPPPTVGRPALRRADVPPCRHRAAVWQPKLNSLHRRGGRRRRRSGGGSGGEAPRRRPGGGRGGARPSGVAALGPAAAAILRFRPPPIVDCFERGAVSLSALRRSGCSAAGPRPGSGRRRRLVQGRVASAGAPAHVAARAPARMQRSASSAAGAAAPRRRVAQGAPALVRVRSPAHLPRSPPMPCSTMAARMEASDLVIIPLGPQNSVADTLCWDKSTFSKNGITESESQKLM